VLVQVKGNRAYRLITRTRVEEKVLELQSSKRALADAIVNADNSVIRSITGEDLNLLLSCCREALAKKSERRRREI
jgi:SNF2 family DNA or RNA helicase